MARTYKMRSFKNGQNKSGTPFINYSLTVPTPLAEKLIDDFENLEFEIELTKEGILYKPVSGEITVPGTLPFKQGKRSNGNGKATPATKSTGTTKAKPAAKANGTKPKAAPKQTAAQKAATKRASATRPSRPKPAPKAKAAPKAPSAPKASGKAKVAPKAPVAPKARPKPRAKATA